MRRQLVDTTPLAALINNRPALVSLLSPAILRDELATSIVVYGELITTDSDFLRVPGLRVLLLDRTTFRPVPR
jgi:hypothetical protein